MKQFNPKKCVKKIKAQNLFKKNLYKLILILTFKLTFKKIQQKMFLLSIKMQQKFLQTTSAFYFVKKVIK